MAAHLRKTVLLLGLLAAVLTLPATVGCLVVRKSSARVRGDAVVKGKLHAVKEGETRREDIVRAFGAPTQTLKLEGGREILVYVYRRDHDVNLTILFLLRWETDVKRTVRFNFELQDGVLVRYWKDDIS